MKKKQKKSSFFSFNVGSMNLATMKDLHRLLLLVLAAIVTFFLWWFLLMQPWINQHRSYKNKVKAIQQQIKVLNDQANILIAKHSGENIASQKKNLTSDIDRLNFNLSLFEDDIVSPAKITHVMRDLLNQQAGLTLIAMKSKVPVRMIARSAGGRDIYENNISLEFYGDYFATLDYLKNLENIPWRVFWDGLSYKVMEYPNAKITLTFHVVSWGGGA